MLQTYLRSKNALLLLKEVNVIDYLLYAQLLVKGEVLNLHMK
jgi:hypothetical protein